MTMPGRGKAAIAITIAKIPLAPDAAIAQDPIEKRVDAVFAEFSSCVPQDKSCSR